MANSTDNSLSTLLSTLKTSLDASIHAIPEKTSLNPPTEELTLLTTKNELFLSYVHNLVFLILVKLRHTALRAEDSEERKDVAQLNQEVTEKLAELRLYLEKGIKPLEGRLKYQVDKVIRAAEEASRPQASTKKATKSATKHNQDDVSGSDVSDGASDAGSDSSEEMADLAAGPNQAALLRRTNATDSKEKSASDGIYRPPKITPIAMPVTQGKEAKADRRPAKSAALDEFIATEFSTAPMAEPSIGSTIRAGGRHTLSQRERDTDADRRRYEEENFTRLPAASKKERAKQGKPSRSAFGGEEWQNLGHGLDRIEQLTKRSSSGAGLLARSRKRAVQDGPRDSGEQTTAKRQKPSRR
jgi:U3 small nucleolar ribonucleoprotein protein LCP5